MFDEKEFEKCAKCGGEYFNYRNVGKVAKGTFSDTIIHESDLTELNVFQCVQCLTVAKVYSVK